MFFGGGVIVLCLERDGGLSGAEAERPTSHGGPHTLHTNTQITRINENDDFEFGLLISICRTKCEKFQWKPNNANCRNKICFSSKQCLFYYHLNNTGFGFFEKNRLSVIFP